MTNALDLDRRLQIRRAAPQCPRASSSSGAGNTAIDAAIAAVRLGAKDVHIVYRRGPEQMSAFTFEYEHAKSEE